MKNFILIITIPILFFNLKLYEANKIVENKLIIKTISISKKKTSEISQIQNFDTLIPIEIVNKKSKNVYKKYGLEFTGNCYACDLAEFKIKKNAISIINVCNIQNIINLPIVNQKSDENQIIIETKTYKFIFKKIETEPIYKLEIVNGKFDKKNLRISQYYTFKKNLPKFEVHDCGDFQG